MKIATNTVSDVGRYVQDILFIHHQQRLPKSLQNMMLIMYFTSWSCLYTTASFIYHRVCLVTYCIAPSRVTVKSPAILRLISFPTVCSSLFLCDYGLCASGY